MWQSPSQRIRAIAATKRKLHGAKGNKIHIKRVRADIKLMSTLGVPGIWEIRIVLNDLTPLRVELYSPKPIQQGEEVAITLEYPKRIYLRGVVSWCQEHCVDSHIISTVDFSYRIGIRLIFQSQEEETTVKSFYDELMKNVLQLETEAA